MKKTNNFKLTPKMVYDFKGRQQHRDHTIISDPTLETITIITTGTKMNPGEEITLPLTPV